MTDISNPNDKFAKETFSRPKLAKTFLANCLPPTLAECLDLEHLEVLKDSFVDSDLKEFFSDLLYRVPLRGGATGFVYVLLEHKSAPDRWVAFQLLCYMVKIWEPLAKTSRGKKLPPIIPIVFYQGRPRWRIPHNFAALIETHNEDSLGKYIPDFEYQLYDMANYDSDKFNGDLKLRVGMEAMKSRLTGAQPATFREFLKLAKPLQSRGRDELEYLMTALTYYSVAAKGLSKADFRDAVGEVLPRRKEKIMSTVAKELRAEARQEGRQQGHREGRQEGQQEGMVKLTLVLLQQRLGRISAAIRRKIVSLSSEKLEELGLALIEFRTQKDLSNWLARQDRTR